MRLRLRLFLGLAAALAVSFAAVLWWVETDLSGRLEDGLRRELEATARVLALATRERVFSDSLADELGRVGGLRVTLISPGGVVLGDSEVPAMWLPEVENHAGRPEVSAALRGRVGSARRASGTVARSLMYVAVPHPQGALRVARPADDVEAAVASGRRLAVAGLALGLALALGVAAVLERTVASQLADVRRRVESLPGGPGQTPARLGPARGRELAALARTVAALEERLGSAVEGLRAERDDLQRLFDTLEDGLVVLDRRGVVVRANRAFSSWTGRADLEGRRLATLFRSPEVAEATERGLGGEPQSREVVLGERTALLSVQPHRGGALVVLHDLTNLRRLEGVRRDFVANVSHELKTPLTSVAGFAEAIAAGELPAEQAREFAGRIVANARRMRALVDDLLDLARIESGGWEPEPRPLDVTEAARAVWAGMPAAEARGMRLEAASAAAGTDVPAPRALADPEAVRQILRNLFDNAIRYAPEGSAVELRVSERDGHVRVEVADRGPGIPTAHRSRVFERFYRVDPARSREEGGTGLGLSIVKHLVAAHGGEVGVEGEVGAGTTVWFTLPAAPG